jgi:hypothetical protein
MFTGTPKPWSPTTHKSRMCKSLQYPLLKSLGVEIPPSTCQKTSNTQGNTHGFECTKSTPKTTNVPSAKYKGIRLPKAKSQDFECPKYFQGTIRLPKALSRKFPSRTYYLLTLLPYEDDPLARIHPKSLPPQSPKSFPFSFHLREHHGSLQT